jgi:hypothetical protein
VPSAVARRCHERKFLRVKVFRRSFICEGQIDSCQFGKFLFACCFSTANLAKMPERYFTVAAAQAYKTWQFLVAN